MPVCADYASPRLHSDIATSANELRTQKACSLSDRRLHRPSLQERTREPQPSRLSWNLGRCNCRSSNQKDLPETVTLPIRESVSW